MMTVAHLCQLFYAIIIPFHIEGLMNNIPCTSRSSFTSRRGKKTDVKPVKGKPGATYLQLGQASDQEEEPVACLEGYIPEGQRKELEQLLRNAGYRDVLLGGESENGEQQSTLSPNAFRYRYIKASGMLKLIEGPKNGSREAPNYIPVQSGMENVLVANGWSFLDPDESEPMSAFDLDAANKEGQYKRKWGLEEEIRDGSSMNLSSLGYNLQREPYDDVVEASQSVGVTSQAKKILLEGGTDPPHIKRTNNGHDFSSGTLQSESSLPEGIFVCAIGSLPLFSSVDMSPLILSGSGGWLSFTRPIAEDHVKLVHPNKLDLDQRIEVLDARTGCHLGHFFGTSDGYCINASALNFVPLEKVSGDNSKELADSISPFSWRTFLGDYVGKTDSNTPTITPSREMLLRNVILSRAEKEEIVLGAGCFWHVEFALRRLPGVIDTKAGYAGGTIPDPNYKAVCGGKSGHAEVVKVSFDPTVCDARKLIDCWLAMHDPTIVRAHGKRARRTGQYRSCVFVFSEHMQRTANEAAKSCEHQLEKELSSEVEILATNNFWAAEERHQRHDERKQSADLNTLSFDQWLLKYGRRNTSVLGSSESIQVEVDDDDLDDGMARMMI
mmetsp:Transcript_9009/g.20320  ORF Transcript_9009/g.20320 Transcript_9009/m.20320 type:complete len:611 (-) Transcript_9009:178-2010(-)